MFNEFTRPVVNNYIAELIRIKRQSIENNKESLLKLMQQDDYTGVVRDFMSISLDLGERTGKTFLIGQLATLNDLILSDGFVYKNNKLLLSIPKCRALGESLNYMPSKLETVYVDDANRTYNASERALLFRKFGSIHTLFVFLG